MLSVMQIPYPKRLGMEHAKDYILVDDMSIEQWIIPKDTKVKVLTTSNFGWIFLPEGCQDRRGFIIPKRIFKY